MKPADLSRLAGKVWQLRDLPGVKPWNCQRLWRSVLQMGLRAANTYQREDFVAAAAAMQILDELDRKWVRGR